MVRAGRMEKIMSKNNDPAKIAESNEAVRELAVEELDCIAGGWPGSNWAWGTTTIKTTGISGDATSQGHPNWIEGS
jgi:hypothetical protein